MHLWLKSHTHFLAQHPNVSISFWSFNVSCVLNFTIANTVICKKSNSESVSVEISLMYRENNNGPRMVPCGTPDKTGAHIKVSPFTTRMHSRWRHHKSPSSLLMMLTEWRMDRLAHPHPYHEGRSCSKFGKIPPSGLEESLTDRWTDAGRMDCKSNVALAQPNHEMKWCRKFGWIPPSGLGEIGQMDGWWMHGKIMLLLHTLTTRGSSRFGWILPSGLGGDSVTDRWTDDRRIEK